MTVAHLEPASTAMGGCKVGHQVRGVEVERLVAEVPLPVDLEGKHLWPQFADQPIHERRRYYVLAVAASLEAGGVPDLG